MHALLSHIYHMYITHFILIQNMHKQKHINVQALLSHRLTYEYLMYMQLINSLLHMKSVIMPINDSIIHSR